MRISMKDRELCREVLFLGLVCLGVLLAILWLAIFRPLAWDEVEFLRATRWVSRGRIPYRDFWEHHTPLQWFIFAPLDRVGGGPGASAVLWLRWCQVPLWGVALAAWYRWIKRACGPAWLVLLAMALLLCSPFFILFAVEYRIDTLASVLLLLGLTLLLTEGRAWRAPLAGALLGAVPMANLRLGPTVGLILVAACFTDLRERRWGLNRDGLWCAFGGVVVWGLGALCLLSTHTWGPFWTQVWADNAAFAASTPASSRAFWTILGQAVKQWDLAVPLLLVLALAALPQVIRNLRRPSGQHLVAGAFLANLVLVYQLNIHYFYHFQALLLLALPLAVLSFSNWVSVGDRVRRARIVAGSACVLILALLLNQAFGMASVRQDRQLAYQDEIMREVEGRTRPDESVWDGCGFALDREPAYERWFLPLLVRTSVRAGRMKALSPDAFLAHPPAAVVFNARLYSWCAESRDLATVLIQNYLPLRPHLWIPAPNGLLGPGLREKSWRILRSGHYRLAASPKLAEHPWFRWPFDYGMITGIQREGIQLDMVQASSDADPGLDLNLDGKPLPPDTRRLDLSAGQEFKARWRGQGFLGLMLAPEEIPALFVRASSPKGIDPPLNTYYCQ